MAKDLEQILSLLNEMKISNSSNAQNFDRLLERISTKLDLSDGNSSINLINAYVGELKKSVDDKYSVTISRIEDIEKALKAVYNVQNDQIKSSEMRDFFDVFTKNVNNFYTEAKQEKAILTSIEGRLSELINNKSDKEDIMRTVSLLRKDFENLNYAYKSIIDDVNTNLKSIISGLNRLDPLKTNDSVRAQIDIMFNSINSIITMLQELDSKNSKLEQILEKVVSKEDLEHTTDLIETLIKVTNTLEQKVNELAPKADLEEIKDDIVTQKNFLELNKQAEDLLSEVTSLKETLTNVASEMEQIPDTKTLEDALRGVYSHIENLNNNIENSNIKGDIFDINYSISSLKDELLSLKDLSKEYFERNNNIIEKFISETEIKEGLSFVSTTSETLTRKTEDIETSLNSLSEYIQGNLPVNFDYVKEQLASIKESLAASQELIHDVIPPDNSHETSTLEYIEQIKDFIEKNQVNTDVKDKLTEIQDALINYNTYSETGLAKITEKIDEFASKISEVSKNSGINEKSLEELAALKTSVENLQKIINEQTNDNSDEVQTAHIKEFISSKLSELSSDIDEITQASESRINQGFSYNTALLEEKTDLILNFIKNIKLPKIDNTEIIQKIEQVSVGLNDFRQELALIDADIASNISSQTDMIMQEFLPIREMIENIGLEKYVASINLKIDELHNLFKQYVPSDDNLEDLYKRVAADIKNTENKLKDFVLCDTDALIIKIDNLRAYTEETFKSIVLPDDNKMKELNDFASGIDNFKQDILGAVKNVSKDIGQKQEELKSMLSVAMHHDDIVNAIDELKISFRTKIQKLNKKLSKDGAKVEETEVNDGEYAEVLREFKNDYHQFALVVENLSAKNTDIENVLAVLSEKIDSIIERQNKREEEDAYKIVEEGDEIKGTEKQPSAKFDFEQALDLLKKGIGNLKLSVDKVLKNQNDTIETPVPVVQSASIDPEDIIVPLTARLEMMLEAIRVNWLREFRNYMDNRNLDSMIQSINNKLDYMSVGGTGSEATVDPREIKEAVDDTITPQMNMLNAKLDVIASSDGTDLLSDLSETLEDLDYKMSESEAQITSMLEKLSAKIDSIPHNIPQNVQIQSENCDEPVVNNIVDTTEFQKSIEEVKNLISEQQSYIELMDSDDEKIETFKECLDNLTLEIDNLTSNSNDDNERLQKSLKEMKDSLMTAVVSIFDQVSFIEESEDIKDFVEEKTDEIYQEIEGINTRLGKLATSDDLAERLKSVATVDDITEKLKSIATVDDITEKLKSVATVNDITEKLKNVATSDDINSNLAAVTQQLRRMTTNDEADDYVYSMQDIETDLAKLRLALNDLQQNNLQSSELALIADRLHAITSSVDMLTQDEMSALKKELTTLKEQTQFLIATSDKSYNVLNSGMEDFGQLLNENITQKVDKICTMLEDSADSDDMVRKSLTFMGEWIDNASINLDKICTNSDEIEKVAATAVKIKGIAQDNFEQCELLTKQIEALEEKFDAFEELEERFEQQERRIERLEMNIEKVLDAIENIDDTDVNRKIDRLEKQILKLSSGIEKLTSYVE